jgi:fucose 4-O-acetylase-like acetyltransferase
VTTQQRDLGLDVLKGIGCALMVVAHSKLKMWNYEEYIFWGNLAPALFFSVSGVTASFQARKPLREMLLLYGMIFLLGFSYSGFLAPDFLGNFQFEIIQTIALGVLTIYFVEYWFSPSVWVYGVLGLVAFGLDKLLYPLGFEFLEGILIAPGLFPLLPWLSMFFFGVFAYRIKNYHNLLLFLAFAGVYYFLFGAVVPDVNESKWQFLPEFFIASAGTLFLAFFLIRSFSLLRHPTLNWLTIFWGANSLLFLYIHYAFIKLFRLFEFQRNIEVIWNNPWLFWVLVLAFTTFAILIITWLTRWFEFVFSHLLVWGILLVLIFIAPFIISKPSYVGYFELLLGVVFAAFYPTLSKILKQEPL